MELDTVINDLNQKITIQGVGVDKLEHKALMEVEKAFLTQYRPEKALIIYGTLAPGQPNHSKIEHIKGEWLKGSIKGKLVNEGWGAALGYFGFKHSPIYEQETIKAYILISDELADHWPYLDDFEGEGYRRILVKYDLENGAVGVGNIYAINDASH